MDAPTMEMSDVARTIFSGSPKDPCTNMLGFDAPENFPTNATLEQRTKLEMDFVRDFMFAGIEYLWNTKSIKLDEVTDEQFELIKKYMESVGYRPHLIRVWHEDVTVNKIMVRAEIWFENMWPDFLKKYAQAQSTGSCSMSHEFIGGPNGPNGP